MFSEQENFKYAFLTILATPYQGILFSLPTPKSGTRDNRHHSECCIAREMNFGV